MDCLEGRGPADVMELVDRLGAWMLVASGLTDSVEEGETLCRRAVSSGKALELFLANVARQGGDVAKLHALRGRYRSPFSAELKAGSSGFILSIDAWKIDTAGVHLGVGRNTTSDSVSSDVGFIFNKKKGDAVTEGDLVATVYGKDRESLEPAMALSREALCIAADRPALSSAILEELSAS